ncbi:MAG TPA: HAMP domain-containing sensor histidine kinase [Sphingobacteriaceae bacterium]
MKEIVNVTLENEMDLILSHRKAVKVAERLDLTISTQTAFATAVSEVCREIIERTDQGNLLLGIDQEDGRYFLTAHIKFSQDIPFDSSEEGYQYAKKLVPFISIFNQDDCRIVELKMGLPRSSKINPVKIQMLTEQFKTEKPYTAYEEVKRRNEALNLIAEERYEKLLQSQYINDKKNEFISIASHELKTPVTIIKAYSQIALAASGEDQCSEKIKSYLSRIELQSSRLTSLIQQLLDVSKIERGNIQYQMETVEMTGFLEETLSLIKHIVPNRVLNISMEENITASLDKARIEQVLSNVIGNAAKYSNVDTPIDIKMNNREGNVVITITDYGIGMDPTHLENIFEKFYREEEVSENYAGLGLGLYISSKIMADHGGKIHVESRVGEGSTFHLLLPVSKALKS